MLGKKDDSEYQTQCLWLRRLSVNTLRYENNRNGLMDEHRR